MDHEAARWSRHSHGWRQSSAPQPVPGAAAVAPEQMHLVSQGYPVRIRRALLAGGLALALAVGGTLAASLTSGSTLPTSGQSDAVVGTSGSIGS